VILEQTAQRGLRSSAAVSTSPFSVSFFLSLVSLISTPLPTLPFLRVLPCLPVRRAAGPGQFQRSRATAANPSASLRFPTDSIASHIPLSPLFPPDRSPFLCSSVVSFLSSLRLGDLWFAALLASPIFLLLFLCLVRTFFLYLCGSPVHRSPSIVSLAEVCTPRRFVGRFPV